MKKITVIGAGIGGLTTAIALKQKGFHVEVFESAAEFKRAGSGINLAMNAMQVFKKLGVYEDILSAANYTHRMNSVTPDLRAIAPIEFKSLETVFEVKNAAIHRATLHEILLKHLGDSPVYLNKRLASLRQTDGKVHLEFKDGSNHEAEIVIGADGIHSAVRTSLFPNSELRDAQQFCWRGISKADIDVSFDHELNEAWGKGSRFGFVRIAKDAIYWYALIDKNRLHEPDSDPGQFFKEYHPLVQQLIDSTPPNDILFNEIWDLKPIENWHSGNVCLVGDAAHATTPNMGQGACQAIESALSISICLSEDTNVSKAFDRYQSMRHAKALGVVKTSWKLGKLAQSSNPLVILLRNSLMKIVPSKSIDKRNQKLFTLNLK